MAHVATTKTELGYGRKVCGECGADWPCQQAVMGWCAGLTKTLGYCTCGWHETKAAAPAPQRH